jgi:vacuole morphology and inheritance protein 14
LSGFIEILRERMYATDPFARSYHLGWIEAIEKIPNSKMVDYLPDFIDAVFIMLGDQQQDIYSKLVLV